MDTQLTSRPAHYAKGKVCFSGSDGSGFKCRAQRLAEHLKAKWTHRDGGYLMSPAKFARLQFLFDAGCDASVITGKLELPPEISKGLSQWVADYRSARSSGNVKLAKSVRSNILAECKKFGLSPDEVFGAAPESPDGGEVRLRYTAADGKPLMLCYGKHEGFSAYWIETTGGARLTPHRFCSLARFHEIRDDLQVTSDTVAA